MGISAAFRNLHGELIVYAPVSAQVSLCATNASKSKLAHGPVLFCRSSQGLEDLGELVHVIGPLHKGDPEHEFCKNAPSGPEIYASAIRLGPKEELWRSVPSGDPKTGRIKWGTAQCSRGNVQCHHLTRHLCLRIGVLSGESKISNLERAVARYEQIIRFHILCTLSFQQHSSRSPARTIRLAYPMENPVAMTKFEALERHEHPRFEICRLEDETVVFDHSLEISVEKLEHQVQVGLVRKDVQQLYIHNAGSAPGNDSWGGRADLDDIGMLELAKKLDFADGRHVKPILELAHFDLSARTPAALAHAAHANKTLDPPF